ncbi:DL-glycerol-3-phosphatase [Coemansia sp. RSA 2523]|nr:DL-glycerol-3-phosphatase [Coemansia sp. RSA 2523]KAJ2166510.1 DL-glycerol-3-phosphatase [Coemansia sp. RSA 562]
MVDITAQGILFDMDGTLVNTIACVERGWTDLANEHSIDAQALLNTVHGHPTYDVLRAWFPPHMHTRQYAQSFEHQLMHDTRGVFAVPGALRVLSMLKDSEWAIVTAATEDLALTRMQQIGLDAPKKLVADTSVKKGKPDPEGYEVGARLLGISPKDAVVFEDSVNGVVAGCAAGCTVVGVLTSTHEDKLREAGAKYVIKDFTQVQISHANGLVITLDI